MGGLRSRAPGPRPPIAVERIEGVVLAMLESAPKNAMHRSRAKMADPSGLSRSTRRVWTALGLRRGSGLWSSRDIRFEPGSDP